MFPTAGYCDSVSPLLSPAITAADIYQSPGRSTQLCLLFWGTELENSEGEKNAITLQGTLFRFHLLVLYTYIYIIFMPLSKAISMAECKRDAKRVLMHWSYISFALNYQHFSCFSPSCVSIKAPTFLANVTEVPRKICDKYNKVTYFFIVHHEQYTVCHVTGVPYYSSNSPGFGLCGELEGYFDTMCTAMLVKDNINLTVRYMFS